MPRPTERFSVTIGMGWHPAACGLGFMIKTHPQLRATLVKRATFAVGDPVFFKSDFLSEVLCQIVRIMPDEGGGHQFRVRTEDGGQEWVARENQLLRPTG
jgi:hypothetical protein